MIQQLIHTTAEIGTASLTDIPDKALLMVPVGIFLLLNAKTDLDTVGSVIATAIISYLLMLAGFFGGISLWGVLT